MKHRSRTRNDDGFGRRVGLRALGIVMVIGDILGQAAVAGACGPLPNAVSGAIASASIGKGAKLVKHPDKK